VGLITSERKTGWLFRLIFLGTNNDVKQTLFSFYLFLGGDDAPNVSSLNVICIDFEYDQSKLELKLMS